MDLTKKPRLKNKKFTKSAEGEECTLNSPCCSYDTSTTVFCHLNEQFAGKGLGFKAIDIGFYGCYSCHTAYDTDKLDDKYFYLLRAVIRTWQRMMEKGLIQ